MTGRSRLVVTVGVAWSLFQLLTGILGSYHLLIQFSIHLSFAVLLGLLLHPLAPARVSPPSRMWARALDVFLPLSTVLAGLYLPWQFDRVTGRVPFVDDVMLLDVIYGTVMIILVLEVGRRVVGLTLPLLTVAFMAYSFLGPYVPGVFRHRGISIERFVDYQLLTPSGLWGTPTAVSATTVFYFVLFAAFLQQSGGGQLFIDLATVLTARTRGGGAKAAVVGSALMGTISGSSTANVVATGIFTIPLMKRIGYSPAFAGAVEASASTGGQLMPPIMGAGAFIMAQLLGVPYFTLAVAATIPAVIYFVSIFVLVDLMAQKEHLQGLSREETRQIRASLRQRLHLLIPLVVLIYFVFSGYTLSGAAVRSIGVTVLVGFLARATRMDLRSIIQALADGARSAVSIAIPCALAGVIVGSLVQSGLSLKFTEMIVVLSGGVLLVALLLTMLAQIILGTGMPTTAAYVMGAILLVPTLIQLGVSPMAAHMFVFYFGSLSMITPPVAISSYAAAGIANAGVYETSWMAFRMVLVAFMVPFAFVYNPALILEGSIAEIAWTTATTTVGLLPLAATVLGFFRGRMLSLWERGLTFGAAVLLITPEKLTDVLGLGLFVVWMLAVRQLGRKAGPKQWPPASPGSPPGDKASAQGG